MAKKLKGLGNYFGNIDTNINVDFAYKVIDVPLDQIVTVPDQPRQHFDEKALGELATSIQTLGLIQPITVRHIPPDGAGTKSRYKIISGERRYRASQLIKGKDSIRAYVLPVKTDLEMLEMALVENIQREDLNALEIAHTYDRLMNECKLDQNQLADRIGKGRSTVTNYLGLLRLPERVQSALSSNQISMGHARALKGLGELGVAEQIAILEEVMNNKLSVRETERLVAKIKNRQPKPSPKKNKSLVHYQDAEKQLRRQLDTKVRLTVDEEDKGKITISFENKEDFNRIWDLLKKDA
ncbi:MAG: ParB/RepB/Spo0J family partition protein [Saprospiraceae bacterium]|nr:ParB/RepB/Spo0J family partition protein [Saprospiraceae bacterium]